MCLVPGSREPDPDANEVYISDAHHIADAHDVGDVDGYRHRDSDGHRLCTCHDVGELSRGVRSGVVRCRLHVGGQARVPAIIGPVLVTGPHKAGSFRAVLRGHLSG
jgi:hypothetical protein